MVDGFLSEKNSYLFYTSRGLQILFLVGGERGLICESILPTILSLNVVNWCDEMVLNRQLSPGNSLGIKCSPWREAVFEILICDFVTLKYCTRPGLLFFPNLTGNFIKVITSWKCVTPVYLSCSWSSIAIAPCRFGLEQIRFDISELHSSRPAISFFAFFKYNIWSIVHRIKSSNHSNPHEFFYNCRW